MKHRRKFLWLLTVPAVILLGLLVWYTVRVNGFDPPVDYAVPAEILGDLTGTERAEKVTELYFHPFRPGFLRFVWVVDDCDFTDAEDLGDGYYQLDFELSVRGADQRFASLIQSGIGTDGRTVSCQWVMKLGERTNEKGEEEVYIAELMRPAAWQIATGHTSDDEAPVESEPDDGVPDEITVDGQSYLVRQYATVGDTVRYAAYEADAACGSEWDMLAKSTDAGASWQVVCDAPAQNYSTAVCLLFFLDEDDGFLGYTARGGIDGAVLYRTRDGGAHFSPVRLPDIRAELSDSESYTVFVQPEQLTQAADGTLTLLLAQEDGVGDYHGGVWGRFISADGGDTWEFDGEIDPPEAG